MWQHIAEELKKELPKTEHEAWISPIQEQVHSEKFSELSLICPNNYYINKTREYQP
jgi:chromosomal replication initiation ATPase DnaA